MAKKRTARLAGQLAPPISPTTLIERMQNSGMMRVRDMMMQPSVVIAARMQKPIGRKSKGRRKGA